MLYLCDECIEKKKTTVVCQAFTSYTCALCKGEFNHPNSGIPVICNGCAVTQNKCQNCKKSIRGTNG